jgi:decaprenylphospho-beta-D-ribofuranose 2-oxidase
MQPLLQKLTGWGHFPVESCYLSRPTKISQLEQILARGAERDYIPRGLGRAYGDSALNREAGVIDQTGFDHFLEFDRARGVIECEAGVSLADVIACVLPEGWFLPVTPGTKFVTIGGAIAADVHGKNHHAVGSIGNFVLHLDLLTAAGSVLRCSPAENSAIFWATVGGMGLTGIIIRARLQLVGVETAFCNVEYRRTTSLDHTLEQLAESENRYCYSVAWLDCMASGGSLGRSVLMLANVAAAGELPARFRSQPLRLPHKRTLQVPCQMPSRLLTPWTVRAFNELYYRTHPDARRVVDFDAFFYPLDSVVNWNRIYGRRGFIQYQALFPPSVSRPALIELLEEIVASKMGSFLSVLKTSGASTPGLLSYLYPGHTLALDFPYIGPALRGVLDRLDKILLKHGGRLYLAKDATMTAETFAIMYPTLPQFKEIKQQIDPHNRFVSSQARRVGIVEAA